MLLLGSAPTFNASAQSPAPGLKAAQYRLLAKGEPAPFAGVVVGIETYRAESEQIKAQAALIASQKALISKMAEDTTQYAKKYRAADQRYVLQTEQAVAAQRSADASGVALVASEQARAVAAPRWYEKPLTVGPLCFTAGVLATVYAISKF